MAPDLLDEVDFPQQIDAVGGREHVPAVAGRRDVESEATQDPHDVGIGYGGAEERGEARAPEMELRRLSRSRVAVDDRPRDLAGTDEAPSAQSRVAWPRGRR